jgi:gliding motility-associated-like protein
MSMKANRYLYLLLLACVCYCVRSSAQATCPGSALAPVFKQTFGTSALSTSKNAAPSGFITNYAYNNSGNLADGQYMVTPLVQNAGKNDWAVGGDHTGDVNGNMFLVNAGTGASLFFKQQVNDLCPGSTFSFSAWLANVNTASVTGPICGASIVYPNVTFYIKDINGNILGSFNTGNVPLTSNVNVVPNWKQYGFQFALPSGITSLVLEMVDFYGGLPQCGNDLAIDDIMFSACTPQATISFNTSNAICAGSTVTVKTSLLNSPFVSPAYQLQQSNTGGLLWFDVGAPTTADSIVISNVSSLNNGLYRVVIGPDISSLSSLTCTASSNSLQLTVRFLPAVLIVANNPVCTNSTLDLTANITDGLPPYLYNWSGPGFTSSSDHPTIANVNGAANAGSYVLTVTDANGCVGTAKELVAVSVLPSIAAAGTDQVVCNVTTVTLDANAPVSGIGTWTQVSGPNTALIVNPLLRNTAVQNMIAGTYKFRWSIALGPCSSSTDDVEIKISPATVSGTLAGGNTICVTANNGSLTLTGNTGDILQWESSTDNGSTWNIIANTNNTFSFSNLTATTSYRVLVQSGNCAAAYSNIETLTVSQQTVAGVLAGNVSVCATSNSGTISVSGSVGNIMRWETSTDNGNTWNIVANTNNTFSFTNLAVTTLYRVLVKNNPCTQQYTNAITVTVYQPVVAGTATGDAVVCASSNAGTVALTGTGGTIQQWESSIDNGNTWSVLSNTTQNLFYNDLATTTRYRVLVANGNCAVQYSNTVTITVDEITVAGTMTGSASVCALANSGAVTLTGYTGSIVHWETSTDNGTTWNMISGTASSYNYNNLATGTMFKVNVKNGVCAAQYSTQAMVTTATMTNGGTLSGDATVCASSNSGTISLTGYTGDIIQWEISNDNGNTWNIIANTSDHYAYNNITATGLFRVLVQSGNCNTAYSNAVTITVNQATIAGVLSGGATLCASANSGTISLTGNTGNIIHWESSIDNGSTWNVIASTNNSYAFNNLTLTTIYRTLIQSGICASQYSNNVTVTIDAPTVAGTLSGNAALCASSNSGNVSLSGYVGNIIYWESSTDNGNTWNVIGNTTNTLAYNNLSTTTIYKALLQSGTCNALYTNNVTIAIDQPTIAGVLSGDVTLCASTNSGSISLTGNTGNIIHWESSIDNGSTWNVIANTNNSYAFNNLIITTIYRALIQNGVCASQYSNNVTITIDAPTVAGTLSGNAALCASSNSGNISLAGYTGNIIHWESSTDNGNTWNVIANTTNTLAYNNLSTTTIYKALVQSGTCNALYSNNVTIAIDQATIAGVLSGDVTLCASANSGTISLTGNTGNIIHWESSIDNGSTWNVIANTNNSYAFNNLTLTTIYRTLIQSGICASQYSNNVTVTIDAPTVAGTLSGNAALCASSNSGNVSLTGYTGNIIHWESSTDNGNTWNVITNNNNTFSYNNLAATTIYKALVQSGTCNALYSNNVTIAIDQPTIAGVLSGDVTLCASANSGTISLTGNTGNIIHWESSVDHGSTWSVIANTSNTLSYNNLTTTTIYKALIQNGVCASQYSDNVTITIDAPTIAGTLSGNAALCASSNSGNISLSGYTGNIIHWESSTDNGNTWNVIANNNNTFSYNNLAATTIYKALVQSGTCNALYTNNVTIAIDQPTIAGVLSGDATLCASANSGTILLTGNTGNIIHWEYSIDNGNTWNVIANTTNNYVFNNLNTTTVYRALIQNGVCASQYSNNVIITIDAPTVAGNLSANAILCASANSGTLSLTGNTGDIIYWKSSTDNGNTWNLISNTTNTLSYNNLSTTTIYKALVQSGTCNALFSNNITISIDQPTVPGILSGDITLCASANSGTISLTGNTGSIIHWEYSIDNGNTWNVIVNTNNTLSYNNLTATTVYKALIQNGVCASQYSNNVTVTIDAPTIAGTLSGNAALCASSNSGNVSLSGYTGNIIHWESSTDNGNTWNVIGNTTNTLAYSNLSTTTIYKALVQSGTCNALYSNTVTIAIDQPTIAGVLSGDVTLCASANSGTISLTGNTGSIIHWEYSIDNGNTWNVIVNTNNNYAFNNLIITTIYRALIQNGVCASQYSNNVTITIDAPTVAGTLSGNAALCASSNSGNISLAGYTGNIIHWESSIDNGNTWDVIGNTTNTLAYNNLSTTTIYKALVQSGTCNALYSNTVTIAIDQPTIAGVLSGDVTLCASANSGTISLTGNTGNIIHWESSIDNGSTWNVIANTTNNYVFNNLNTTTVYRALIQNGVCASQYSNNVTITIDAPTVPGTLSGNAAPCASSNSGNISLAGYTGNIIHWESSTDNGNTWNVIANTTNTLAYNNLSTATIYKALVQSGTCNALYSNNVTIAIDQPTIAGILSGDVTLCASANSGTISLTGNTGNIIHWESSVDNGNTWNVIANTSNILSYNNLTTTTLYKALIQNGTCASQYSNNVTVTIDAPTIAGTLLGNAALCASSNSGNVSLTGYTGNIIHWESSTDNGNTWNVIANTTNTLAYNNLSITTIYKAIVQSGTCNALHSNNVTIAIDQATIAGVLSGDVTLCASANSGTISLTGNTGSIIHWEYSIDNGSTWNVVANTTNNYVFNNLNTTTVYRALIQNGVCASQYSNNVTITIDQPVVIGLLNGNATVCAGLSNGSVLLSGYFGNILQWESSTDNGNSWTAQNLTQTSLFYNNIPATTQFRTLLKNGVCPAVYSNVSTISVVPQVVIANAGADQFLCNAGSIQLSGNNQGAGNGAWTLLSGPSVAFANAMLNNTIVTGIAPGTYSFEWRISNGVCADSKDTVMVVVYPSLTNQIDTTTQLICTGQPVTIISQPSTGGNNSFQYQWEKSYDGTTWTNIATTSTYSFIPDSSVFIRRNVVSQTCSSTGNAVAIKVLRSITNNTITGDQQVCQGTITKEITGTLPAGGDGIYFYQWQQSTDNGTHWLVINEARSRNLSLASAFAKSTWVRRIVTTQTCNGPLSNTSNNVFIDVRPVASATLQYNGGVYCKLNTGIEFNMASNHADSIKWNFGDGTIITTTPQNVSHVYSKAGTFLPSVQLMNASGCNTLIASADTIRIDEIKAAFDLAAINDCGKTTYRFVDTSHAYFPITKRVWAINRNSLGNERAMQYVFDANGTNEASLQVNTIYGCAASLQAKFDVSIYTYPKVDINAVGEACLNNLMELKSIVNSLDSVKTRIWNLGNGSSATDSVVQVSFYSEGKYIVKLTVATVNSCYDSAYKQITIHPTPKVTLKAENLVCKGESIELKANGAAGYIWKDQNGNIVCNNCNTLKVSPQKNEEYKVLGYSEYGCSEIASTRVRVIEPFKLTAKTSDTLCIGETKKLTVSGASSYTWRNDAGLSNYNTPGVFASPVVTTIYRVTGKDEFNCFTDTADIRLTVGQPTSFTIGRDTNVLSGVPLQLHAFSSLQNIRSWQWKGNATFSCLSCATPTAKVIMDECLTCTATNIYGCKSTDTICITTFCPGSEVFIPNAFTPDGDGVNDVLFVQGRGIKIIKSFRIFSRWGELVFEKSNFSPGDKSSGWDGRIRGKLASPDVFVYVCEAVCEKGTPAIFKGNTAVLK